MQKFYIGDLVEHVPTGIVSIVDGAVARGEDRGYGLQGVAVGEDVLFGHETLRLIERGDIGARMERDAVPKPSSEGPKFDEYQDVSVRIDDTWQQAIIVSNVGVPDSDDPDVTHWQYSVEFLNGGRAEVPEADIRAR